MYIKGLVNTKDQSNVCMCEMMSKGSKEALTVLIVTHVTHECQKGQKITLCTQYRYIQSYIERVERLCHMLKQGTNTFLLITFLIFNRFSIHKKFWKAEN